MPVLCNFIIYLVKMIFLLFVLDIMLKAPPSGVMGNSEEFCESQQTVACACYKQPKASCREAFCLIETHKVPVLNHCLVQLHYTDCSVLVQAPNIYIKKKVRMGQIYMWWLPSCYQWNLNQSFTVTIISQFAEPVPLWVLSCGHQRHTGSASLACTATWEFHTAWTLT